MTDIVPRLIAAANGDRSWRAALIKDAVAEIRRLRKIDRLTPAGLNRSMGGR
jgi:hypothetical protein